MSPSSTPHLLWARPVSKIPLFVSLHAYSTLLPALHAFRLCHQYGSSNSFLLPPISRLPPSLATRIELHLAASYQRDSHSRWTHRLETAALCSRCLVSPKTREDELRKQICHCRTVFRRELELEVGRIFTGKGCGKEMWDVGDGKGKLTTGMFLRRFCGLELFVEGGAVLGDGLWLCLPFDMKSTSSGAEMEDEKGRLCVGERYTKLAKDAIPRFRFAVESLGMEGDLKKGIQSGERSLEHWHTVDERIDNPNDDFGVKLTLFSAGFVVA